MRFIDVAALCYCVNIMINNYTALLFIFAISFLGCSQEQQQAEKKNVNKPPALSKERAGGCLGCHGNLLLDKPHDIGCIKCHGGNNNSSDKDAAHKGMVARPAHPDQMQISCGNCHAQQLESAKTDIHFTLENKINKIRTHFGANEKIKSLIQVPVPDKIDSRLDLADDMLRKRCLRCHLYSEGDSYPYVQHGTGCAACHLKFTNGQMDSHFFSKPEKRQCLSCHYGNYVGSDFYGKFENDYNWEYRTPYVTSEQFFRPYGVEQYNLTPDIHQQRGFVCIDCHQENGHSSTQSPKCDDCHNYQAAQNTSHYKISKRNEKLYLQTAAGNSHEIPQLKDPAHELYGKKVACQVCHAQWSYNDSTTHLLYSASDDYDLWERLTVQGSQEVEKILEHNLYGDGAELPPTMKDGITGNLKEGVWYKGFSQRRWEEMITARDKDGVIKVFRPILNLRLSMVNQDQELIFDNLTGTTSGLLPYTPHTTGPAGFFYRDRFVHHLKKQKNNKNNYQN